MKTLYSALFTRKTLFVLCALMAATIMVHFGHGGAASGTVLMVGMSFLSDELTIKNLAALKLADATTGLLTAYKSIVAKTVDYTVTGLEPCGTIFTTRGAAGAVNFTLPVASVKFTGLWYRFKNVVDQNMTVTSNPADTLVVDGDLTADSLAASTASHKIGAEIEAFCDGTSWFASGVNGGVTYTVAT